VIVSFRSKLDSLNEFRPFVVSELLVHLLKQFYPLINVHFIMKLTEVTVALSWLPALIVLALVNPHHMRLILSEIESLTWMNLRADTCVEIFVGDLPISVNIKFIKDQLELLLIQSQSPML
jgi:hypothetical protein